ncbi:MAG: DNA primase [Corynebacterium sp.]|nr:DNA primase [Corynebacterium sp.]
MSKGKIPQSDIENIRQQANIADIVGEYVQLKPGGVDSLKGLSPFKDEKTPSFHVRPQRGYYHCFSTGKGGDVYDFLMEMEHISFPEAVELVAEKIGYHINYEGGGPGKREDMGSRKRLIEANRLAFEFYRAQLETPEAQTAREFLTQRGFSAEHAHQFGCGYAPGGWDTLTKYLLSRGLSVKELQDAGLTTIGRRGPIDRFHRRLLWPIRGLSGEVIGFGARKLFDDDNLGKYMNTPETLLYKKSRVLFGLDQAKKHISDSHQAVIVEGYTDVMAMHAAGIKTAVAACGTAFGEEHLQMLRRLMLDDSFFRGELIYTFDGDEAGQKAAMRAFAGEQQFTGQSFVSVAPDGLDPCDLRLKHGDAAVRNLVASRMPMVEFVLRSVLDEFRFDTIESRLSAIRRVVPILGDIRDAQLRKHYITQVAGWVGQTGPDEISRQVSAYMNNKRNESQRQAPIEVQEPQPMTKPEANNPVFAAEREYLKLALQFPAEAHTAGLDNVTEECFSNETYRAIRHAITECGGISLSNEPTWIPKVAGAMQDLVAASVVSELAVDEIHVEPEELVNYAIKIAARVQEVYIGGQIAQLKAQLTRIRPSDDPDGYNAVFAHMVELEQYRRKLRDIIVA